MIRTSSSIGQPRQAEAPAPISLLLDIPREIVPNISSRLPGPDLLKLAQVCKQISMDAKEEMLTNWASRELCEISSLGGEQLWTRLLDLMANCGHMIATDEWNTFLARVESQHKGHAMLLRMAVFSPKVAEGDGSMEGAAQPPSPDFSGEEYKALNTVLEGARKEPWRARAGGAVFAGHWRNAVLFNRRVQWKSFANLLLRLPLFTQVKIIPHLNGHNSRNGCLLEGHARLSAKHTYELLKNFSDPMSRVDLATVSAPYLRSLSEMFVNNLNSRDHLEARLNLRKFAYCSLVHGMAIGPWREQAPEMALFIFLALLWNPDEHPIDQELGKRLIDSGFTTRQEYLDLTKYLQKAKDGTSLNKVQNWLDLNRNKQAKEQAEPSCAIS